MSDKTYKFVYIRDDRFDRSFDGNDFSEIRAKFPKFVIGNKNPETYMYNKVDANTFNSAYCYNSNSVNALTEKEWQILIQQFCKEQIKMFRKDLRTSKKDTYAHNLRLMLLPIYEDALKM